jgi:RNA recognition motif-containing protein
MSHSMSVADEKLPYRVRWQDLKDLFRKAGTVLRADVSLGPENRSRGYGTVLMGSREDAARAIGKLSAA